MGIALRLRARVLVPVALGAAVLTGLPGPSYAASTTGPDYEMPFPCGDTWNGSSRSNHSPSSLSIDWNRTDDFGDMVVAAAPAWSPRRSTSAAAATAATSSSTTATAGPRCTPT